MVYYLNQRKSDSSPNLIDNFIEKMAQQGAALQNYNNELVKCLEELCQRRIRLHKEIDKDQREKQLLDSQLAQLNAKIATLDDSLAKKLETKAEYDRTIRDGEAAYMKILESSQALLSVVKKDSLSLKQAEQEVSKSSPSNTPRI